MKLMSVSDIYGSLPVAERVPKLFVQNGTQWLMTLGNALNHSPCNALPKGYTPTKVAERLNEAVYKVIVVHGNCDGEVNQVPLYFPITAPWRQVLLGKQCLFLTYDHFFGLENLLALNQSDALAYGHTYLPVTEQWGEVFHFNPGLVNILKGGNPASYDMLDNDVLDVIALNDQNIIMQIAINL